MCFPKEVKSCSIFPIYGVVSQLKGLLYIMVLK